MNENQMLDVLTREGVLINVSVRYWRATQKLKPQDLNLEPDNISKRLISLGHKKLLPKESLERFALIEGRAHSLVDSSTFPFLSGLAHFLPNAKLQEVTEKLKTLEGEFNTATAEFLAGLGYLRAQAVAEWIAAAKQLKQDADRVAANIEASFPSPEKMEKAFGFTTQLFQIRVPEKLAAETVSLHEQQQIIHARDQAALEANRQINENAQRFVADCVASLREQTAQLCQEMLVSMQDSKAGVHQKTLNRLVHFIDEFKQLNFVGDKEMEAKLERVRQEFLGRTAEEYRGSGTAQRELRDGIAALRNHAIQLARQDARELVERFGSLGQRRFHLAA